MARKTKAFMTITISDRKCPNETWTIKICGINFTDNSDRIRMCFVITLLTSASLSLWLWIINSIDRSIRWMIGPCCRMISFGVAILYVALMRSAWAWGETSFERNWILKLMVVCYGGREIMYGAAYTITNGIECRLKLLWSNWFGESREKSASSIWLASYKLVSWKEIGASSSSIWSPSWTRFPIQILLNMLTVREREQKQEQEQEREISYKRKSWALARANELMCVCLLMWLTVYPNQET